MKRVLKFIIVFVVVVVGLYFISWQIDFSKRRPNWGITFSQFYTEEKLGLDWKIVYEALLNEFDVQKLRLIAYWQYLEPTRGNFDFKDLDWQIEEAEKRNKEIILVIGYRVPRWPECHIPDWAKNVPEKEFRDTVLNYLSVVVNHYKYFSAIKVWQVENEPLLSLFGQCPKPDREFLKQEIELVKSADPERPIMITDSGELSSWLETAGLSEWLGTTLYRIVWNKYFGWWKHFYPSLFYTLRSFLVKTFYNTQEVIISELQAEPWVPEGEAIIKVPFEQRNTNFDVKQLQSNLEFAQKTGIKEIYLWGVEWWYWRKINGDNTYWQFMKEFLAPPL